MMEIHVQQSRFPVGNILNARHFVTGAPQSIKVGKVSIHRTAAETIKQPIYLRQGRGIILKKFIKPRREHYGAKVARKVKRLDYPDTQSEEECAGILGKVLHEPRVVMTTKPISTDKAYKRLWKANDNLAKLELQLKQRKDIDDAISRRPEIRGIVRPRYVTKLFLPLPTAADDGYAYYDVEDKKPVPKFYNPKPLPSPEISSGSSDLFSSVVEVIPILRRPIGPIVFVKQRGSISQESESSSEASRSGDDRLFPKRKGGVSAVTPLLTRPSSCHLMLPKVTVTSGRVQEYVDLGDVFPHGADKGLVEEIKFYERESRFPLLVRRHSRVDLADYDAKNKFRILPPERVVRVAALTEITTRQHEQMAALLDSDTEETESNNAVFNPLTYSFNRKLYKDIYEFAKSNKL